MNNIAPSPWHDGELAMQRSAGSADKLATRGHLLLRDHLIDQHRQFYPLLPFIVAGAVDRSGDAWATLLGVSATAHNTSSCATSPSCAIRR
jgi:predicted pyridoxine 5'-phosphate oxidase superfamily flavin-nucleotide-binding protein